MTAVSPQALLDEWRLTPEGGPFPGTRALVLPVRTEDGQPAVLKLVPPGRGASAEHLALQHWHGEGAVRLLRADPRRAALLLERLHPEDLRRLGDLEACAIVGGLYRRLHRRAGPQYRPLSSCVQGWAAELAALPRDAAVPRRLVEQAGALCRDFASDAGTDGRLIHTELHYAKVLAADREPWLAIAPEPLSGDPHFEPAPLLWHRWEELGRELRAGLRRRLETVVAAAGLELERARDWAVVRAVRYGVQGGGDPERVTRAVTLVKALQP